jgi:sugar phosphate permease
MFSIAYACSNVFMSDLSKGWNKKWMLGIGIIGFASSSLIAGATNSLILFAAMRFTFGVFAAAINAPIYQLISANFPVEYRTTANAVEASGYHLGAGIASFMALVIRSHGWRSMYRVMGSAAFAVGALILLFVKNP